jgi:arylsulfatase A-like enzyme/Flp pilus assembly protein TadD
LAADGVETRSAPRPRRGRKLGFALALIAAGLLGFWVVKRRPHGKNLLLVTIDTLRADHVGVYGYAQAATPALDALAGRGVRFEHAHSAAPLTGPSHSTILTGLYPPVHGVRDNVVFALDPSHRTLATLLKARGYETGAFVGAYPVAAAFGFRQGFDTFVENFHESPIPGAGAQRRANEVADDAISWLQERGAGPFFLWVHFYDPHAPYDPPEPYKTTMTGRPYDGEIAFADSQLGRVLEALRATGREGDTVVAVLSDHGESLGEHGELTHAVLVYESTLRVPFLLTGPGVATGKVVAQSVGTVDVAHTLMALLGFDGPPGSPGRDLRAAWGKGPLPPEPLYAESIFGRLNCRWSSLRAWTAKDWKLIDGHRTELFNLAEDPGETRNRAADEPQLVNRMRDALRSAVASMAPGGDRPRTAAVTPEQEETLKSLGYAAGSGGAGELDDPTLPDPRDLVHVYERLQILVHAQGMTLEEARQQAILLAEQDAGNPFAHNTVASLSYRTGHLALAARAYHRALELDPDRPAVRQNYGKLLREMERLEESEKELRLALSQTDADDRRTRISLAETLILRGETPEAQKLIEDVLGKTPKDNEALGARGRLLVAQGRAAEAIAPLVEAASSGDADDWIAVARVYLGLRDPEKAREAAGRALQLTGGHPWALAVSGHALILEGKREEGLALLKRSLAAHPRRPEAWLSLAEGFEAARDKAAAEACRRTARSLS